MHCVIYIVSSFLTRRIRLVNAQSCRTVLYSIEDADVNLRSLVIFMPCPHHTSPERKSEDICSHLTYTGLATCGGQVWTASRKPYKSKSCDILKILLSNL